MLDEGLDAAEAHRKRRNLNGVDERLALFESAHAEGHDGAGALHLLLRQCVLGVALQAGEPHPGDLGMGLEVFRDLLGVGLALLDAQRQRTQTACTSQAWWGSMVPPRFLWTLARRA